MATSPPVNTYLTTNNPPRALRRIEGQASLIRAINSQAMRPDPVETTPHPNPIAMNHNYPELGDAVVPRSVFSEQPATASATAGLGDLTRQPRLPNVLHKSQPFETSTEAGPSKFSRYMNKYMCFGGPWMSKNSPLSIGEPHQPLHLMGGPDGEDIEMVQYDTFVGRLPVIKITLAPDVDQHVPNAKRTEWTTHRKSMRSGSSIRGPHLTVSDAWYPGDREDKQVTFLAPPVPSRSPRRAQAGGSLAAYLGELHSEEEALKQGAIEHQMAVANNQAIGRHLKYLKALRLDSIAPTENVRELDGNPLPPATHPELAGNTPVSRHVHELPATPPSEPQELEAPTTTTIEELHGESALLLPQLQPFRATMDFEGLLDDVRGELFELDAQPQNPNESPLNEQAMGNTEASSALRFHYGGSRIEPVPRTFRVPLPSSKAEGSELLDALKLNIWGWCSTPDLQPRDPRTM